jgi:hypothetical protein
MPVWLIFSHACLQKVIKDMHSMILMPTLSISGRWVHNPWLHIQCIDNDGLIFSKVNIDLMTDSNWYR